jgi:hypothetical protein
VAVNPQPLPPNALVDFNPLPNLSLLTNGDHIEHKHVAGVKYETITGAGPVGTVPQNWILETLYGLDVTDTEIVTLPDTASAQPGSYGDTYGVTGTVTQFFIPQTPPNSGIALTDLFAWLEQTTINQLGQISGQLNATSPTAITIDKLTWNAQINENGKETPLLPSGLFGMPSGSPIIPWNFQATLLSVGVLQIQDNSALGSPTVPPPVNATFMQQDEVTVFFLQGNPDHPLIVATVDAVFNAVGNATVQAGILTPGNPGALGSPEADSGNTQYTDSLTETIIMPDGSTQTLTQDSLDNGTFIIAILVG